MSLHLLLCSLFAFCCRGVPTTKGHCWQGLKVLSDQAACAVNGIIGFPSDRKKSRVVCGVLIPALHKLVEVLTPYSGRKAPFSSRPAFTRLVPPRLWRVSVCQDCPLSHLAF